MSVTVTLIGAAAPPGWSQKWLDHVDVYEVTRRCWFRTQTVRVWGYGIVWYVVETGKEAPWWVDSAICEKQRGEREELAMRHRREWARKLVQKGAV